MNSENIVQKKYSFIDSVKTGAYYGVIFSTLIVFAVYFVSKIVLS